MNHNDTYGFGGLQTPKWRHNLLLHYCILHAPDRKKCTRIEVMFDQVNPYQQTMVIIYQNCSSCGGVICNVVSIGYGVHQVVARLLQGEVKAIHLLTEPQMLLTDQQRASRAKVYKESRLGKHHFCTICPV